MLNYVIISNNQNQEHLVSVTYLGEEVEGFKIGDIKESLTKSEYEILFNYDDLGYINSVIIR